MTKLGLRTSFCSLISKTLGVYHAIDVENLFELNVNPLTNSEFSDQCAAAS